MKLLNTFKKVLAMVLGMLPLVIIYCFLQKYFIEGVTAGCVKE